MSDRRQRILDEVTDHAGRFMYYDRKEDESLPRGEIEAAVMAGEIDIAEIVDEFRRVISETVQRARGK